MASVSITSTLKTARPRVPFQRLKGEVLGTAYDLSVAFVGDARMRTLNRTYRNKDRGTNVLAFPLSETAGEIVINPTYARKEAPAFGLSAETYLVYLYIHALLHLKGYTHGSRMEQKERALLRSYT